MVSFISGVFGLFICFLKLLWLYFTEYIEWADAIALGFLAYLFGYHWQLPDKLSIGIGIAVGTVFLLLFHFSKIGWWISTGVFSLMWAYFAGELARSLFRANDIVFWGVITVFFCYFAWLHSYAKQRSLAHEEFRKEEAAARRPKAHDYIETPPDEESRRKLKETFARLNAYNEQQAKKNA